MPGSGQPHDLHWRHFAEVLGVDPDAYDLPTDAVNPALGIVQIEMLRQVNAHLPSYSAHDRGVWIRGYLAEDLLAGQPRERGAVPAEHLARFAELDRTAIDLVLERGFHVLGDLSALAPERSASTGGREPGTVSAAELVESAARTRGRRPGGRPDGDGGRAAALPRDVLTALSPPGRARPRRGAGTWRGR